MESENESQKKPVAQSPAKSYQRSIASPPATSVTCEKTFTMANIMSNFQDGASADDTIATMVNYKDNAESEIKK